MQRQSINTPLQSPLKGFGLALISFALTHSVSAHAGVQTKLVEVPIATAHGMTVQAVSSPPLAASAKQPERIRLLPGRAPVVITQPLLLRRDTDLSSTRSPRPSPSPTPTRVYPGADAVAALPVSLVDQSPPPRYTMRITPQDRRVSEALRAFVSAHGWNLSWEVDRDFPILFDASFTGDVLDIVEQLARALQSVDTPIRVKAYHANKVLRVLYATY